MAAGLLLLVVLMAVPVGHSAKPDSTVVLVVQSSSYTAEQDRFTVSLEVANTAGIQFVYFTFCQLSSPLCYLPVAMAPTGSNWFVGTTLPMSSYHGMTVGVRAGYNITIQYIDNSTSTEPRLPNTFSNLTIAQSVTGEYMFQMTVRPQLYQLTGVVDDLSSGVAVVGATVTLTPGQNVTTTGSTGAYAFPGLLNGTYTVSVTGRGYQTRTDSVSVAGQNAFKNVSLSNTPAPPAQSKGGSFSLLTGAGLWVVVAVVVAVLAVIGTLMWRRKGESREGPAPKGQGSSTETPRRDQ